MFFPIDMKLEEKGRNLILKRDKWTNGVLFVDMAFKQFSVYAFCASVAYTLFYASKVAFYATF